MIETQALNTHRVEDLTDDNDESFWRGPDPGTVVRYFNRTLKKSTGYGIVVACIDDRVTVLWSVLPKNKFQFPVPPKQIQFIEVFKCKIFT